MGTKLALAYVNIYMSKLEQTYHPLLSQLIINAALMIFSSSGHTQLQTSLPSITVTH